MFSQGIITPENAVNLGLIDGIKNLDDIISTTLFYVEDKFSSVKVKEINKKRKGLL